MARIYMRTISMPTVTYHLHYITAIFYTFCKLYCYKLLVFPIFKSFFLFRSENEMLYILMWIFVTSSVFKILVCCDL